MNNLLKGTQKLFGLDYKNFCRDLLLSAEYEQLPVTFELKNTFGLTIQDIADLYRDIKNDTGLELSAHLAMCNECKMLHLTIVVDYSEGEGEEDNIYLQ